MEEKKAPPLLVKIQSVDISTLDFHSGGQQGGSGASKSRHVTYVEATNLFLFVGSTSGTVYLFSRDNLKFLFMIPFKGGKVCDIAVTMDESEVAVASIRGRVSIYRISPTVHLRQSSSSSNKNSSRSISSSSGSGEAFKHLYDVPHHLQNEITEMQWSPNGNFLFIGDNQGLISQVDVGSLEEFPRPPPSRIILKLQSRILQIDCAFPYLAICTLTATYLCDLEREDFARILSPDAKSDVKAAGLTLAIVENSEDNSHEMILFICEFETHRLYRCGMDGSVKSWGIVKLSKSGIERPVLLFDPKQSSEENVQVENCEDVNFNFSPGRMFATDDGFIISVCSDRIFVFDSQEEGGNIILWNDSFKRINSFKIIANYGFVWYGTKLEVFALTPFRSYGKQLLKASLNSVLENWIGHAIKSLGWKTAVNNENGESCENNREFTDSLENDDLDDPNASVLRLFRAMMDPLEEDDEFCDFVASHLPFPLMEPKPEPELSQQELHDKIFTKCLDELLSSIQSLNFNRGIVDLIEALGLIQKFYQDLGAIVPQLEKQTLQKVLHSSHIFTKQPQFHDLKTDLSRHSMQQCVQDKIIIPILHCLGQQQLHEENFQDEIQILLFTQYAKGPVIQKYFRDLEIPKRTLILDSFLADLIILLLPLVKNEDEFFQFLESRLKLKDQIHNLFFTWLILLLFFGDKTHNLPYGSLLRPIQNLQIFDKLAEEILASIYRDALIAVPSKSSTKIPFFIGNEVISETWILNGVKLLPNFITFVILFSKAEMRPRGFSLLLHLFPMKRSTNKEISDKIVEICNFSPIFTNMLRKACLEDGNSLKLCSCFLPDGSLEGKIPSFQRAIEEAILTVLIENYLSNDLPQQGKKELLRSPVHLFAMRRCLLKQYFESAVSDEILSDKEKIRVILRSGLCNSLQFLRFNLENLKGIREGVKKCGESKCGKCGKSLVEKISKISMDCVGVWVLENVGNIERFMKIVKKMKMDCKGEFSYKFYRFLITRDHLRKTRKEDSGFGDLVSLSNLTCMALH